VADKQNEWPLCHPVCHLAARALPPSVHWHRRPWRGDPGLAGIGSENRRQPFRRAARRGGGREIICINPDIF